MVRTTCASDIQSDRSLSFFFFYQSWFFSVIFTRIRSPAPTLEPPSPPPFPKISSPSSVTPCPLRKCHGGPSVSKISFSTLNTQITPPLLAPGLSCLRRPQLFARLFFKDFLHAFFLTSQRSFHPKSMQLFFEKHQTLRITPLLRGRVPHIFPLLKVLCFSSFKLHVLFSAILMLLNVWRIVF